MTADNQPYLGGEKEIPNYPHLILAPGTLIAQWEHELKVFFLPRKVDILTYTGKKAEHQEFWGDTGPFKTSKHDDHQKIILASHSVGH